MTALVERLEKKSNAFSPDLRSRRRAKSGAAVDIGAKGGDFSEKAAALCDGRFSCWGSGNIIHG
jgi:hypothetical protein